MTANELLDSFRTLDQKLKEKGMSAREDMRLWCLKQFNVEPTYTISCLGPSEPTLSFAMLTLPDGQKFGVPPQPNLPEEEVYEKCAKKALYELKIRREPSRHSFPSGDIHGDILPPPPQYWVDGTFKEDSNTQKTQPIRIPQSFVAENQRVLLNATNGRNNNQASLSSIIQSPQQQQQQQPQHPQHPQHSRFIQTRNNGSGRGNYPQDAIILSKRPFILRQPFPPHPQTSFQIRARPQQATQDHSGSTQEAQPTPPTLPTNDSAKKFVPLQVARNKQNPRQLSKTEAPVNSPPSSCGIKIEQKKDTTPSENTPDSKYSSAKKNPPSAKRKSRIVASFGQMNLDQ